MTVTPTRPMLAQSYTPAKCHYPVHVSTKLDGLRCLAHITDEGVLLFSRDLKPITSMQHVQDELAALGLPTGTVLDGELFAPSLSFQVQNGIIRRKKPTPEALAVQYHIYDLARDASGPLTAPFHQRYVRILNLIPDTATHLRIVRQWPAYSHEEVVAFERQFVDLGMEGAMVRTEIIDRKGVMRPAGYETEDSGHTRRSWSLQKVKSFEDGEFLIVDIYEEHDLDGNPKGRAAGFVMEDPTRTRDGSPLRFQCSGLTDEMKARVWSNPGEFVGQTATVKFFGRSDEGTPRHPNFKALRPAGQLDEAI
ncbi:hypothetical protein IHN63_00665 [Deinococcus sp. 6YEL10]|uniref:ATP-dependent DNA ligase n=1 Tax=Deinococcus sp. 6YEL10 TaxID=2745870 RepID=UPI001E461F84|nr:hypothetical protein [Deinococcus sp. 6YEL10]MCD0159810.1 hypothetical protein [Deinococcus sp. 6YEL10]